MASEIKPITSVTRGNDVDLRFTIGTSRAINTAKLVIKRIVTDDDSAALINKTVTTTLTGSGQIVQQGGSGNPAIIVFSLSKTETNSFQADADYAYDVECFDAANKSATPVGGTWRVNQRVRTALG